MRIPHSYLNIQSCVRRNKTRFKVSGNHNDPISQLIFPTHFPRIIVFFDYSMRSFQHLWTAFSCGLSSLHMNCLVFLPKGATMNSFQYQLVLYLVLHCWNTNLKLCHGCQLQFTLWFTYMYRVSFQVIMGWKKAIFRTLYIIHVNLIQLFWEGIS